MNIAFIINNWEKVNPSKSSTLRMIYESCLRGHRVGILYSQDFTIRNNVAYGLVKLLKEESYSFNSFSSFHKKMKFEEKMVPINIFDAILLRKSPPIDSTMLNFLDSIKDEVFIVNDIDGIRKSNNKLYTSSFHDPHNEFIPKTFVSKNITYLKNVIQGFSADKMILKPLDGFGGSGVIIIEKSAYKNLNSLLDFYVNGERGKNYVIVQEYIPEADKGDVRILMLNGEPIGAYNRIPSPEDNRSNINAGGSAASYKLSKDELRICKNIGQKLLKDGIYFAGIDTIAGKLIEVNVLNPGGIVNINKMNKVQLEKNIIDFVERKADEITDSFTQKEYRISRRKNSKEEVINHFLNNFPEKAD